MLLIYKLNGVNTEDIKCPVHTQENAHPIHECCAQTVDQIVVHLTIFFYNTFTTSINLADSTKMHVNYHKMHRL